MGFAYKILRARTEADRIEVAASVVSNRYDAGREMFGNMRADLIEVEDDFLWLTEEVSFWSN